MAATTKQSGASQNHFAVNAFENVPGFGVCAELVISKDGADNISTQHLYIGSERWLTKHHIRVSFEVRRAMQEEQNQGRTVVVIVSDSELLAWLSIGD